MTMFRTADEFAQDCRTNRNNLARKLHTARALLRTKQRDVGQEFIDRYRRVKATGGDLFPNPERRSACQKVADSYRAALNALQEGQANSGNHPDAQSIIDAMQHHVAMLDEIAAKAQF